MPTDSRRVRGPEVSQSPSLFASQPADLVSPQGPRLDRRQRDQVDLRPVFVRCGLVSQAKGSAYLEAGSSKLMCCVYGPRETERKDETDMKCGRRVSLFVGGNDVYLAYNAALPPSWALVTSSIGGPPVDVP